MKLYAKNPAGGKYDGETLAPLRFAIALDECVPR